MLREQINDIMTRWNPKERPGSKYDPLLFVETPEQARRLMSHLREELEKARKERNSELTTEIREVLNKVEGLAKRFFRWEEDTQRNLELHELQEIRKLPIGF